MIFYIHREDGSFERLDSNKALIMVRFTETDKKMIGEMPLGMVHFTRYNEEMFSKENVETLMSDMKKAEDARERERIREANKKELFPGADPCA